MNKKGFTLIELLVVVLIIGILSAVALPQYQKTVLKSRAAEAWTNLSALRKAVEVYCLENPNSSDYLTDMDSLSIKVEDSANFSYTLDHYCSTIPGRGVDGVYATYKKSPSFMLGYGFKGVRSCRGAACRDLGFTAEGTDGAGQCFCGTGGNCYYMD